LPINVAELTAWSADFLSGKLRCRQSGRRAYVGIGRKAFKIWLTASIVWIIAIVTAIYAGAVFPVGYQANFPLRTDLEPWNDAWQINGPLRHPLYEIIRSPAAEKLPLTFQWRGYSTGRWNEHIHARD
jgi:hypothetical protein